MEILNKIDSILNFVFAISLIGSIYFMITTKKHINQSNGQNSLDKNEKIITWVTCLGTPLFAGAVYYYGWKKIFPQKAKQANNISWLAMLILAFAWFTVSALINK
jgi:hypothetical protein